MHFRDLCLNFKNISFTHKLIFINYWYFINWDIGQISASVSMKWEHCVIFAYFKDDLDHTAMEPETKVFSTW